MILFLLFRLKKLVTKSTFSRNASWKAHQRQASQVLSDGEPDNTPGCAGITRCSGLARSLVLSEHKSSSHLVCSCFFSDIYLPGLLLSSMILFEILYGWLGISILPKTMIYPKERYPSKIGYALLTPIVFLLLAQNAFASAITQKIHWAGRTYRKPKN